MAWDNKKIINSMFIGKFSGLQEDDYEDLYGYVD